MIYKNQDGSISMNYEGYYIEGIISGWQVETDECTYKYAGEFLDDIFHGRGTHTDLEKGTIYKITYYKNVPRGELKVTFPFGSVFEGRILQNLARSLDSYDFYELD